MKWRFWFTSAYDPPHWLWSPNIINNSDTPDWFRSDWLALVERLGHPAAAELRSDMAKYSKKK